MRFEDLRGLKVADPVFALPDGRLLPHASHQHAVQAQWHTVNCLGRFAGNGVDGVANEQIAIVEWWRTIESLVALLHLIAEVESEAGMRPEQARLRSSRWDNFHGKLSAMAHWFSGGSATAPKTITRLVTELRDFRNVFEHTSRAGVVDVRYSRLGAEPAMANLADVFEAMAICVLVCDWLRYVLPGNDVMPQVVVPSRAHVFYVPLDRLATELLFPLYVQAVASAGLTTDVAPYPVGSGFAGRAQLLVRPLLKAKPDQADVRLLSPLDLWPAFEAFAQAQPEVAGSETFGLPRYSLSVIMP
jgi:hypothetical protein